LAVGERAVINLTPHRTGQYDKEVQEYVERVKKRLHEQFGVQLWAYKIVGSYGTNRFDRDHKSDIDIEIVLDKIPKEIPRTDDLKKLWTIEALKPEKIRERDFTIHGVVSSATI
jgi:predicted nucleotidyltransferase